LVNVNLKPEKIIMKKYFITIFIFIATNCIGQDIVPITYGPLVSMTSTSLKSNPDFVDQVAGAGYNFGIMTRLKVLFFYAQAECSYGTKSASVTVSDTGGNNNTTYKLKGLDVTAIAGFKLIGIRDIGNVRIFGGYNWNNYTDITYSVDGSVFSANNVNNNNHSILIGAGVDLLKFSFDLKFINGFADLTQSSQSKVESQVVNLTVTYRLK
jgi:hypothetical protein